MGELSASNVALTEALRSPTARGVWGENQLRNVIELAGMTPYCDYEEQPTGENRSGNIGRPDVRVRLPNGAHLAVDAKVPLDAYLEAQESSDQSEVENHLSVMHPLCERMLTHWQGASIGSKMMDLRQNL